MPANKHNNLTQTATAMLPTRYGIFQLSIYKSLPDGREHAAIVMGNITDEPVLTRIHSQCFTGDTLFSLRCDCGEQLVKSMQMIQENGTGIILYLSQEGRDIGLSNKIKAYALQESGLDTVEANVALGFTPDARNYDIAADILKDLGITKIELLTNNPDKVKQLRNDDIVVTKRIPLETKPNQYNRTYLAAKKQKLGQLLTTV